MSVALESGAAVSEQSLIAAAEKYWKAFAARTKN
jgi:hypothetical protein